MSAVLRTLLPTVLVLALILANQRRPQSAPREDNKPNTTDSAPPPPISPTAAPLASTSIAVATASAASEEERLASAALALAPGRERTLRIDAALERWTLRDPVAVAEWIARSLQDPEEFDRATARLVARTDALQRPTALAREWAETLTDPAIRLDALVHVVHEWAEQDEEAALRYAEREAPVSAAHRERLLEAMRPAERET